MSKEPSKAPTGLTVTRSGNTFTCKWKIPSGGYGDGQQFEYKLDFWEKWHHLGDSSSISKTATEKSVTINLGYYYPGESGKTVSQFLCRVRGNRDQKSDNKGWSAWSVGTFDFNVPPAPVVTMGAGSPAATVTNFNWSVSGTEADSHTPYAQVKILHKLVSDCTVAPEYADWSGATELTSTATSGTTTITEASADVASGAKTRIFCIWAEGAAGQSAATYSKRVYSAPNQAKQSGGTGSTLDTAGGYDIGVEWDTQKDESRPIDYSNVEWAIAVPNSDMSCPSSGVSWTVGATVTESDQAESAHVITDQRLSYDQCLYTRVNTVHESKTTYGTPVLRKIGELSPPTNLSVTNVSQTNQTAKITATNASTVSGTILEIIYRKNGSETVVGTISGSPNYKTVKCPPWTNEDSVSFGVRAVLPKSTATVTTDGVTIYTIVPYMSSACVWQEGSVATAPGNLSLSKEGDDVIVKWKNNWEDANLIELSWSDNENAWESTDPPETFEIDNPFATQWRISGLEAGKTWHVRMRAAYDNGESKTYSPYSEKPEINLSSSPLIPSLALSQSRVSIGQGFTASWEYTSTDGTAQVEARIYEYSGGTYTELTRVQTQEHVDLPGWSTAGTHSLCVEVISASGQSSGKSDTVVVQVATPLSYILDSGLVSRTVDGRSIKVLTALPLNVAVVPTSGSSAAKTISIAIERAESYHVERPDGSQVDGYKGETIVSKTWAERSVTTRIELDDLTGCLDDGAAYYLKAIVSDNIGQSAELECYFEAHWASKALIPEGHYLLDQEMCIATITPVAPTGTPSSAHCDIYRLSADKPVLVYKGAEFGSDYVDPYPAIGEHGGYRLVYMTAEENYITSGNVIAFLDMQENTLDKSAAIIDFGGEQVELIWDIDISAQWKKDFEKKKSLGGAVRGYWKPGVSRTGSLAAVTVVSEEMDTILAMRRLSEHVGRCYVRTPEGSCFPADVQVTENWSKDAGGKLVSFSLSIDRTDEKEPAGRLLAEWQGGNA